MDDEDALLVVSCAAVAQAAVLFAEETDDFPRGSKTQILTVNILHFESLLQSAAYASWFVSNLRCTKHTFLRVADFLRDCGVAFAPAKVKQHSYEKKVAAALYFLGSTGGYREVSAAMGMSRSYVKEITAEVVRVIVLCLRVGRLRPRKFERFCNVIESCTDALHCFSCFKPFTVSLLSLLPPPTRMLATIAS